MKKLIPLLAVVIFATVGCEHMNFMTRADVKEAEQKKEIQEKVSTLQKTTADVNSRFADNESEMRQLNGRLEVLENRIGQGNLDKEKNKKEIEIHIVELNQKVALLQEELTKMDGELNLVKSARIEAPVANTRVESTKSNQFDVAEELFAKKEWKKAILNYQKFRDANPKNKKAPEAAYKIGVCFQELGMKDEAKTFFDDVISKYPNSPEARKSRTRTKKL